MCKCKLKDKCKYGNDLDKTNLLKKPYCFYPPGCTTTFKQALFEANNSESYNTDISLYTLVKYKY